jgi:hypothetical protein
MSTFALHRNPAPEWCQQQRVCQSLLSQNLLCSADDSGMLMGYAPMAMGPVYAYPPEYGMPGKPLSLMCAFQYGYERP